MTDLLLAITILFVPLGLMVAIAILQYKKNEKDDEIWQKLINDYIKSSKP